MTKTKIIHLVKDIIAIINLVILIKMINNTILINNIFLINNTVLINTIILINNLIKISNIKIYKHHKIYNNIKIINIIKIIKYIHNQILKGHIILNILNIQDIPKIHIQSVKDRDIRAQGIKNQSTIIRDRMIHIVNQVNLVITVVTIEHNINVVGIKSEIMKQ